MVDLLLGAWRTKIIRKKQLELFQAIGNTVAILVGNGSCRAILIHG